MKNKQLEARRPKEDSKEMGKEKKKMRKSLQEHIARALADTDTAFVLSWAQQESNYPTASCQQLTNKTK